MLTVSHKHVTFVTIKTTLCVVCGTVSDLCLHHERPVHAQIVHDAVHIHNIFPFNLEDQTVNGYEGTCAPNSSTEQGEERKT